MAEIVFEDKQVERSFVDTMRSPGFRRLKSHMNAEANAENGDAKALAEALSAAFKSALLEDIIEETEG